MVAILCKQTQNAIWLLYYIYKHKTRYVIWLQTQNYIILYKQTQTHGCYNKQNAIWLLYYINKHKTRYGCYIIYTNTKRDMVAILYKQTQNAICLLYYITNTKRDMVAILYKQTQNAQYGCYILYIQTQNAIWLLYYINKHKTRYGCYII